ncbi:hypothetical protein JM18_002763 [Phytophthora kernoviae]|uniref:Transmembrane protein n=2 Tax=Phytophthora kernoviae TaxID=325452 RepID=A0A922AQV7_9STRA|nr:hypothetical protein G195_003697 [Phytophthora kernoviae 00238/432]KAG2529507.1 hypothetical protein JM18_002763 [Phytophthora kernoviae]
MRRLDASVAWLLWTIALFCQWEVHHVCLADPIVVSLSPTTFQIDSKTKIKDVFKCSSIHSIGSFNEYYVACELHVPNQDSLKLLEIVNVTIDGAALSPLQGVHTELTFQLNTSLATVSLLNAQLKASAVEFHAANVLMDEHSSVNVSGRGLKFGPGYNSWGTGMGGSYGGIGGASLTGLHPHCDDMPPNDFFRPSRGGGRIRLGADGCVDINGSLLANGGDACADCYDSAGSGGSILITATERIHGNATVQANGGQPSVYNSRVLSGGGGGGGGGVDMVVAQGYVGPSSQLERDLFGLTFVGADVSLSNAMVMVHEFAITARGAFSIDKYSELKFRARVRIQTDASIKIEGFLQPLSKPFEILRGLGPDNVPVVSLVSKKDVELRPQTVEMGSIMLYVNASGMGFVDMPFDTPFLRLSISAANVSIANVNSGPVLGCKEIAPQADAATCSKLNGSDPETQPYSVGVFASELATFGNISAGSMILCSGNSMTIEGTISSASLGCVSGVGPGKSEIAGEASGGAGHELAMQQSVTWADAVASAEKGWPIWPGSGAASGDTPNKIIGGYGGNSNCTVCGIGETTAKVGSTMCVACKIKPAHSEFNMRGNCSYACAKGRNGLDCLTPFERLVKPIGGPIGFVILVFSVTGLIFGSWGFFSYRSSRSELRRYAQYKAQRLRDELSLETLTRTLTPRLTDQDLSAHVARLYLSGDNHLKSGWRLNPYFLPASLRDIVEEGTYANFASTCNKLLEWDPADINRKLRVLPQPSSAVRRVREAAEVARDILAFVEGFNEKHSALWSVLGILPTAIVGSPLLGLMFVTRKSIFYGKLFTMWNCSSIVNQVVAFVCGLVYLAYIHDNILLVAIGGVLVKYFEKEIALRCIAQYASERPLRGWRGLHTTRDWYDAAYTPLVHYES